MRRSEKISDRLAESNNREEQLIKNRMENESDCRFKGVIGNCDKMQKVFRLVERVSQCDSTILINGETGTGKGLIAKAIHENSKRRDEPFVAINCGAIPENLLESELFGHVRGAFTGATSAKSGKFEMANEGTIFLDEIGDMSPDLQVKILKVLEEKEFEPVGGCKTVRVNVRIIAATHRDLEDAVQKGRFREDLFYRLFVIPVELPALRDRRTDIPLLAKYFISELNRTKGTNIGSFSPNAMELLVEHHWPGNVRELANIMERLAVLKGDGDIDIEDLPGRIKKNNRPSQSHGPTLSADGINLNTAVSEFEKSLIFQSLEKTNWVKNRAAKLLNVKRTTLVEKIKRYDIRQCA